MLLEFRVIELKMKHEWTIATGVNNPSGGSTAVKTVVIQLKDGGLVGLGEAARSGRYEQPTDVIVDFLKKIDPSKLSFDNIPGSMAYLDTLTDKHPYHDSSAKCGINIALLDGATKKAKVPIYDFFKLGFKENKHISSYTIGIDKAEVITKKVLEAAPFPILKVKLGAPNDREIMAALRAAAPTKTVRVDANEGWKTKEEALRNIEWLATDPNVEFIEQPLPAITPAKEMAWLKSRSPLPLLADESYHTAKDIDFCVECFHGVNVKLLKTGGISNAYEALQVARKHKMKTMIGCMVETSILIGAAAHLAELTDFLDIDGNILCNNDPYIGPTAENKGMVTFAGATEQYGLRVKARAADPFAS